MLMLAEEPVLAEPPTLARPSLMVDTAGYDFGARQASWGASAGVRRMYEVDVPVSPDPCGRRCYRIPYSDRSGSHIGVKWGATPEEAIRYLKKSHAGRKGRGGATYGEPELLDPQPFSDESRAANAQRSRESDKLAAVEVVAVPVDTFESDEDVLLTPDHDESTE